MEKYCWYLNEVRKNQAVDLEESGGLNLEYSCRLSISQIYPGKITQGEVACLETPLVALENGSESICCCYPNSGAKEKRKH